MRSSNAISKPFIKSPFLEKILSLIDSLRYKKNHYGIASCMLITGESGSGKSELAKYYVKSNPVIEYEEYTKVPVLHFELKSVSTPESFLRSLLVAIGDPQNGKGAKNKDELYTRLVRLIKLTDLELLILDEIQVIIERRTAKVVTGIADIFKDLIKDTEVPIVFMGMPWSRYLIDSNKQLRGRISYRYIIPPFRIGDKECRNQYRILLKMLGNAYGIDTSFRLEDLSMSIRIFAATNGNLRSTANLLCDVFILSDIEKRSVSVSLFSDVMRDYGVEDDINPFLLPLNKLILKELIVHSDWNFGSRANKNSIIDAQYVTYGVDHNSKLFVVNG